MNNQNFKFQGENEFANGWFYKEEGEWYKRICNNLYNAKIIEIDKLEPAEDGIWFHRQGEWAAIENRQIDQAVEHMRYIHKLKQENGPQINLSGIETASKFSWENTLERIINE